MLYFWLREVKTVESYIMFLGNRITSNLIGFVVDNQLSKPISSYQCRPIFLFMNQCYHLSSHLPGNFVLFWLLAFPVFKGLQSAPWFPPNIYIINSNYTCLTCKYSLTRKFVLIKTSFHNKCFTNFSILADLLIIIINYVSWIWIVMSFHISLM